MAIPPADADRFELVRSDLYTAVVGDVLDQLGRGRQFLGPRVRPLTPGTVVVGRAMPVLIADVFGPQPKPFARLTQALDSLQPGEVYLARSARSDCAAWGELLTTAASARGACGAVIDGYHRDTSRLLSLGWPVFSWGAYGQDAGVRSEVLDYRVPIEIEGVPVRPGDLVFGDADGVVTVPSEIEDEVLERATDKVSAESLVRDAIAAGAGVVATFERYGVL